MFDGQTLGLRRGPHECHDVVRQDAEVERHLTQPEGARLQLREVEDVGDQGQQALPCTVHDLDEPPLLGVQLGVLEQLVRADQAGERCPELVADVGKEQGLGLVRVLGLGLRGSQGLLGGRQLPGLDDARTIATPREHGQSQGDSHDDHDDLVDVVALVRA